MAKNLTQRIVAFVLCGLALVLIVAGTYYTSQRTGESQEALLSSMRTNAVLNATGEGAVESYVAAAKKRAAAEAKAAGGGMAEIREASTRAEEEARASYSASGVDYSGTDTTSLSTALVTLRSAQADYSAEESQAQATYIEQHADTLLVEEVPAPEEAPAEAPADAEAVDSMGEDGLDMLSTAAEEPEVDLSGFQATAEMQRLQAIVDEKYQLVAVELEKIDSALDATAALELQDTVLALTCQPNDHYETEYDRYAKNGGLKGLGGSQTTAFAIRYGDDMIVLGVAFIILSLLLFFYQRIVQKVGIPLLIIGSFFLLLCVLSALLDLNLNDLLSNALVRMGMNSVMVLAMVPAIQCGITLNLGLPVGIMGGLIGGLLCIEFGFSGWWGFVFAIVVGLIISGVLGYLYGLLLNRLKGNEMAVTTYVGFSIVSLMSIAWLVLPFNSLVLKWPLGNGLRTTISLEPAFQYLLDRFLAFKIGGITVPTGLLLFMGLCCFLVWLFTKTKTGIAMQAAGNNPRFAEATGINVDKMRILGTTFSTMLGSVGILLYSQSYGFMQLYQGPRTLGLVAASAILIGGATTSRARVSNVLIGTFLFHGVLTFSMPVANALVPGSTIAETLRILVSNGIILYALTKWGGSSRG